jgi:CO/xanthine dehydrogenase FAD-binding subunit
MTVVRATTVAEAVDALRELRGAVLVSGGTEVVVGLNEGTLEAPHLVTLRRIPELRGVRTEGVDIRLGALTTYAQLAAGTGGVPALTAMAPTVGSPASRNTGTLGGALGTGSGFGDAVTALLALEAEVEVEGAAGPRRVPVAQWLDRTGRDAGDLVTAVRVPSGTGSQHYLKAGERQAVFYAIASCALVVDVAARRVRCALGSVAVTAVRAREAEDLAAQELAWEGDRPVADADLCRRFGDLVAASLPEPPFALRASAAHRRHVAGVLATRALTRATAA